MQGNVGNDKGIVKQMVVKRSIVKAIIRAASTIVRAIVKRR